MGIKAFKPTSPGRRTQTVLTYDEITAERPYNRLPKVSKESTDATIADGSPFVIADRGTSGDIASSIFAGINSVFPEK
jgi:ribosomal protein L2